MTQHQLENIELRFQEGSSDKVYKAVIEPSGDGFIVSFAYGCRGATLNTGVKTPVPIPYEEALRVYAMIGIIEVLAGIAIMVGIGWGVGWLYQYALSARLCREAAGRYGCRELRDGMVALVSVGA